MANVSNVTGIITAIVLTLAGFVAYKNQGAYEKEISDTLSEKERLTKSQARSEIAKSNLAEAVAKRSELNGENLKLAEEEIAQTKINEGRSSQFTALTAKIAGNKSKLDEFREKTSKVGDIKDLASKMKALKTDLEDLTQSVAINEAKLANINAENSQAESQVTALKNEFEIIGQNRSLASLKTHIRSIYPTWGFVTLAAGNDAGVVAGSTLDVIRDGSPIAKLLVTAVERNSASASVMPDSIAADVNLMTGDRVISSQKSPTQAIKN